MTSTTMAWVIRSELVLEKEVINFQVPSNLLRSEQRRRGRAIRLKRVKARVSARVGVEADLSLAKIDLRNREDRA